MLDIMNSQYEVMAEYAGARLVDRLTAMLQRDFPERYAADALSARQLAEHAVGKSAGYGIEDKADIEVIARRMAHEGAEFEYEPHNRDIRRILEDAGIPGDEKVHAIHCQEVEKALGEGSQ